ncbi:MAG TPA: tetratricopeptide repeat protein [Fimbriimonadaceae bacterium]|jgi:tetratricopeptide (TPR) repeat protein
MKAIAMAEASSNIPTRDWLGSLLNNTAWTYYELGDYDKALELFKKALAFRVSKGVESPILIARYCVAKCLRATGETQQALQMQLALELEHIQIGNDPGFVYEEIAECLFALGRGDESKPYFLKAYSALSKDEWLMAEEPARVEKLKAMAG